MKDKNCGNCAKRDKTDCKHYGLNVVGNGFVCNEHKTSRVNHPQHYNQLPNGIECIDVIEYFNLNRGNALKYVWRAGYKGNEIEDLEKAIWYLQREIERVKKECHIENGSLCLRCRKYHNLTCPHRMYESLPNTDFDWTCTEFEQ